MAMLNIGGENAGDAFYRYKMPKLQCKIEGRGNGIKTNVVNNVDIAKALERPPEYVIKYFGIELGAQTKFDKKIGTSIVNGAHDQKKLSEILESFIKKYVQCYGCGNPETVIKIKKENIYLKCKACGHVSTVDPKFRLNTFIIKNPPENKLSKAEKKVKKAEKERLKGLESEGSTKEEKKKKKKKKSSKESKEDGPDGEQAPSEEQDVTEDRDDDDDEEEEDEEDVVWMTDTSDEAMKKRAQEQLSSATAKMVTQGNLEADRAAAKKREEKRKAEEEKARLEEEARRLALNDPVSVLNTALSASPTDMNAIREAFAGLPGNMPAKVSVLYSSLFSDSKQEALLQLVQKKSPVLHEFASDSASQLAQLMAFEALMATSFKDRMKEIPFILKYLFEEDIIDEEIIIGWHHKANAGAVLGVSPEDAKAIRDAAQPIVQWLEEAETDDDSSEEED